MLPVTSLNSIGGNGKRENFNKLCQLGHKCGVDIENWNSKIRLLKQSSPYIQIKMIKTLLH